MNDIWQTFLDDALPRVQRPAQYIGGEFNSVVKDHAEVDVTLALAFPDTYTIGMSNQGLQILYAIVGAAFMPMLAVVLLLLNGRGKLVGKDLRNRPVTIAILVATVVFFAVAGSLAVVQKIGL